MPRTKKYGKKAKGGSRKRFRRRRYSRRKGGLPNRGGSRITKMVSRGIGPFPDKVYCKLKYFCYVNFAGTSSTGAYYTFRGNSLFQPEYTTTGAQPLYYSQYANAYDKYFVLGSKISVTYYPTAGNGDVLPTTVVVQPSKSAVFSDSYTVAAERPGARYRNVDYYSANGKSRVVKNYVSTGKMFGLTGKQVFYDQEDYSASVTTNPVTGFFWHVHAGPMVGPGKSEGWQGIAQITLTYYCMFYDRKLVTSTSP